MSSVSHRRRHHCHRRRAGNRLAGHHVHLSAPFTCRWEVAYTMFYQRKAAEKAEKAPRKAKKDPKAPKRALSAYMFFSQDWRERIKNENPDAGFGK